MDIKRLEPLILAGQATEAQMAEVGVDRVAAIKTAPTAVNLREFVGETKQLGPRRFGFAMSSERPDHVGDILKGDGWDVVTFRKNPVALWGHGRTNDVPIGTWPSVTVNAEVAGTKGLVGEMEFAPAGASEFADTIHRLTEAGVIKATSVGLRFLETRDIKDAKERQELGLGPYGIFSVRHMLLECSLVSVGMNPDALARSCDELLTKGLVLRGGVEQVLKTVPVTERDWANVIRELCAKSYPAASIPDSECRYDEAKDAEVTDTADPDWVGSLTEEVLALRRDFSSLSSRIDAWSSLASTQAEAIRKLADANERLAGGARPLGSDPGETGAKGNAGAEHDPAEIEKAVDAALGNVRRAATTRR
jgi:hypothetical protein